MPGPREPAAGRALTAENCLTGAAQSAYSRTMKRSTKAALLSGLVFPGIGHLYLRQRLRGAILVLGALIAFAVIVTVSVNQALRVVDKITSGEVAPDTAAITQLIENSATASDDLAVNIALLVLGACWLAGIVDSWRLGVRSDDQPDE